MEVEISDNLISSDNSYFDCDGSSGYAKKLSHLTTIDEKLCLVFEQVDNVSQKLCLVLEHIDNNSRALNDYLIESMEREQRVHSKQKQEIITEVETLLKKFPRIDDNDDDNTELQIIKLNNAVTVIKGKRHLHGRLIGHSGSKIKQLHDKYKGISIIIPSINESDFTDIIIYNLDCDYRTADDLINEIAEILTRN